MPILKPKARIDYNTHREVKADKYAKHDRGTALAFSGDLKHWVGKNKNKPLF